MWIKFLSFLFWALFFFFYLTACDRTSTDSFYGAISQNFLLPPDWLNRRICEAKEAEAQHTQTYIFITACWQRKRMDFRWIFLSYILWKDSFPPSILLKFDTLSRFLSHTIEMGFVRLMYFFLSKRMTKMSKSNRNFERDKFVTFKSHQSLEHIAERFPFSCSHEILNDISSTKFELPYVYF